MHPAFLMEWATDCKIFPTVNETLYSWQMRIAAAFCDYHQKRGFSDVEIAVLYHLGHLSSPDQPDWNDENYPERFTRAAAAVD